MDVILISKEKNRVTMKLSFTPEEIERACGETPAPRAIAAAVEKAGKTQLEQMGLKAMADPEIDLNGDELSAVMTAVCLPVLTQEDCRGLPLREPEGCRSEDEREEQISVQLLEELMKRADFDLPQSMYENEVRQLAAGLLQQMRYDAMAQGRILDVFDPETQEQVQRLGDAAVWEIKRDILIDALLKAIPVEVNQEELEEEGAAIAQRENMTMDKVRSFLGADLSLLSRDIQVKKVFQILKQYAVREDSTAV